MKPKLTRTLKLRCYGKDVDGLKRAVYRGLDREDGGKRLKAHASQKKGETAAMATTRRRTFGPFFVIDLRACLKLLHRPVANAATPTDWVAMGVVNYPDELAYELVQQYNDEHKPPPPPPKYVKPLQGFSSLTEDLWELYSEGRNRGFWDLGTYNRSSKLPSGKPSDHATSHESGYPIAMPACAFDLGFSPAIGYQNAKARAFFHFCVNRPEVNYVICGNQIWSRERGQHSYTYGGHEGHVHVSGHRR